MPDSSRYPTRSDNTLPAVASPAHNTKKKMRAFHPKTGFELIRTPRGTGQKFTLPPPKIVESALPTMLRRARCGHLTTRH